MIFAKSPAREAEARYARLAAEVREHFRVSSGYMGSKWGDTELPVAEVPAIAAALREEANGA